MGDSHSLVGNTDFSVRRKSLVLSGEAVWSDDRALLDTARSTFLNGQALRGFSYRSRLALNGRRFVANLTASGVSPDFRDQLGRFSRVGLESYAARAELTQYPNNRILQRSYSSSVLLTWGIAPASFLYLGYNDARQDFDASVVPAPRVLRTGNLFFLKLSYLYRV